MMRSGNPALNEQVFSQQGARGYSEVMTLQGTVNKCFILLSIILISGMYTYNQLIFAIKTSHVAGGSMVTSGWFLPAMGIFGFVMALITIFKKEWSPFTTPIYALAEGLFLGAVSGFYELKFNGIVFQAISLTACVLFSLLFCYKSRMIKVTENFKLGLFAATGGIALVYLVGFILSFFGMQIPLIHESGPIGIGFSLVVVVIASLNLVMDFDFIENASASGNMPKYMEWYGAFGLMVTLIWLYLEMLRLLSKLNSRD